MNFKEYATELEKMKKSIKWMFHIEKSFLDDTNSYLMLFYPNASKNIFLFQGLGEEEVIQYDLNLNYITFNCIVFLTYSFWSNSVSSILINDHVAEFQAKPQGSENQDDNLLNS